LVGAVQELLDAPAPGKAGLCVDPDDRRAWESMLRWLRAWKKNPQRPDLEGMLNGAQVDTPEKTGAASSSSGAGSRKPKRPAVRFKGKSKPTASGSDPESSSGRGGKDKRDLPRRRRTKRQRAAASTDSGAATTFHPLSEEHRVEFGARSAAIGGEDYGRWLQEQKIEALMHKLADGTKKGYEAAWR